VVWEDGGSNPASYPIQIEIGLFEHAIATVQLIAMRLVIHH
jgi:hypothetical protein